MGEHLVHGRIPSVLDDAAFDINGTICAAAITSHVDCNNSDPATRRKFTSNRTPNVSSKHRFVREQLSLLIASFQNMYVVEQKNEIFEVCSHNKTHLGTRTAHGAKKLLICPFLAEDENRVVRCSAWSRGVVHRCHRFGVVTFLPRSHPKNLSKHPELMGTPPGGTEIQKHVCVLQTEMAKTRKRNCQLQSHFIVGDVAQRRPSSLSGGEFILRLLAI